MNTMHVFVAIRQLIVTLSVSKVEMLQKDIKELREYIEDVFTYQNDINKNTSHFLGSDIFILLD